MIADGTGKEYRRNRRQIHLTQEPTTNLSEYLNDDSDSVTDQYDVNLPSANTESHAQLEPTTISVQVCVALRGLSAFQVDIKTISCTSRFISQGFFRVELLFTPYSSPTYY